MNVGLVLIGIRSVLDIAYTVLDRFSEVEDFCIIGAYSMVKENFKIPRKSLAIGIPVKIVRSLSDEEIKRILAASRSYVELAKEFKKHGL